MRANCTRAAWALCGVLCAAAPAALAQREPPVQKELLERFGFWAERYVREPPVYRATETRQDSRAGKRGITEVREVVSRYVARRESEDREILSIDGKQVEPGAKEARGALLPESVSGPISLVSRLARESQIRMRYFFAPDNADVEVSGDEVVIGYRPMEGTPLVEIDGKPVWGSGMAWVHPDDGHVIRIEEEFEYKNTRYTSAVDFMLDDTVKAWVPRQITARIFEKGRLQVQRIYLYTEFELLEGSRADTAAPTSKPEKQ